MQTSSQPSELPLTAVESQVARLQAARPVAWMHVPKCGTTFGNVLLKLPGMCPNLPDDALIGVTGMVTTVPNALELCPGSFSALAGGTWYEQSGLGGIYESRVKGHGFTMLRQPEQRIMSGWFYNEHSWPFVDQPKYLVEYARLVAGCAVKMLTRTGVDATTTDPNSQKVAVDAFDPSSFSPCSDPEPATAAEVALAKYRLRDFAFVGITDQWDLSMCLLHAVFGGDCLATDLMDTRPGPNGSISLYDTSELMGFTDEADGALFDEALAMFSEQSQHYGVTLETCQSCFQQAVSSK